jgi:transposase
VSKAWVDGHIHAFAFFGAVPQSIVYDNDRGPLSGMLACPVGQGVAKILPDRNPRTMNADKVGKVGKRHPH